MMLRDKYLPQYHFNEIHAIHIAASPDKIFPCLERMDFSSSRLIRFLFLIRGMPSRMMSMEGINHKRFIVLEKVMNKELAIGLIGQFWRISGNLQDFAPTDFIDFSTPGFGKVVWTFQLSNSETGTLLETETRIYCPDESARKKFSRYWFFIKPFSGIVRKEILKAIRKQAEA